MRQHPIPQNILDVEFKLFTRFSLKEFAYLAIGVGIGGVFLYFTTKGQFPGVVGIPMFILFSGVGLFFALVPINGQPADKFISNFFTAINRPTQRVWLNSALKDQRAKPIVQTEKKKQKIFGGSKIEGETVIFDEGSGDDIFEEKEKGSPVKEVVEEKEEKILTPSIQEPIIINQENISKYQFKIESVDKLPGNINLWLSTKEYQPVANVQTYLKDKDDKILYANKTGKEGYFLTHKEYPEGIYNIEFEGTSHSLPPIQIVLTKGMGKLPYKITAE